MSKQKPPAFQFYPKDFLEGTTAMSNAACGAYCRLLSHAWNQEPLGSLPNDDYALFKLSGADTKEEWQAYSSIVLGKFKLVEGRWWHERLVAERVKQTRHNEKVSERGKKGAEARWGKKDKNTEEIEMVEGKGFDDEEE